MRCPWCYIEGRIARNYLGQWECTICRAKLKEQVREIETKVKVTEFVLS